MFYLVLFVFLKYVFVNDSKNFHNLTQLFFI